MKKTGTSRQSTNLRFHCLRLLAQTLRHAPRRRPAAPSRRPDAVRLPRSTASPNGGRGTPSFRRVGPRRIPFGAVPDPGAAGRPGPELQAFWARAPVAAADVGRSACLRRGPHPDGDDLLVSRCPRSDRRRPRPLLQHPDRARRCLRHPMPGPCPGAWVPIWWSMAQTSTRSGRCLASSHRPRRCPTGRVIQVWRPASSSSPKGAPSDAPTVRYRRCTPTSPATRRGR